MGQKEKIIARIKAGKKDITFDEVKTLLEYLSFHQINKGKTSGSRVMFTSDKYDLKILLHKPHPRKELLDYQIKQLRNLLEQEGLI